MLVPLLDAGEASGQNPRPTIGYNQVLEVESISWGLAATERRGVGLITKRQRK